MSLYITDECIDCDLCPEECPNEAIFIADDTYHINADKCTECVGHYDTPSCVSVCPVECILPDPNHKETVDQLAEKFTAMHG